MRLFFEEATAPALVLVVLGLLSPWALLAAAPLATYAAYVTRRNLDRVRGIVAGPADVAAVGALVARVRPGLSVHVRTSVGVTRADSARRVIYLGRDLATYADVSPDAADAILVHELAHVLAGDRRGFVFACATRSAAAAALSFVIIQTIADKSFADAVHLNVALLGILIGSLVSAALRRRGELAADAFAVRLGYGPTLDTLFAQGPPARSVLPWARPWATHPTTSCRRAALASR